MKGFFSSLLLNMVLSSSPAMASDIRCRIEDATEQKANEAPGFLESAPSNRTIPPSQERAKDTLRNSAIRPQTPPLRCIKKTACLKLDETGPVKYVLCDAAHNVQLEAYTDNVLIHVVEAATRKDSVRVTTPIKGFTSVTLGSEKPQVQVHCELATESNKDCGLGEEAK